VSVNAEASGVQTGETERQQGETPIDDRESSVTGYRAFDEESFSEVLTYYGSNNHVQVYYYILIIIIIIIIIINEEIIVAFSHKNYKDTLQSKDTKPQTTSCLAV